jgi:catechol 2,3-dioxygenase-like lactoylglutathione lyase family enzyme
MAIKVHDICALLSVYDMPEAVRFYVELLGFELVSRAPTYETIAGVEHSHWCMLRNGSSSLMLNTEYDTGERPAERPAFEEQRFGSWFFFGCEDLDEARRQLEAAGVKCDGPNLAGYGFRTLSVRDPDGHGITLQHPVSK